MDEKDIQPPTSDASRALAVNEREETADLLQTSGSNSEAESDEEEDDDDDDANSM